MDISNNRGKREYKGRLQVAGREFTAEKPERRKEGRIIRLLGNRPQTNGKQHLIKGGRKPKPRTVTKGRGGASGPG